MVMINSNLLLLPVVLPTNITIDILSRLNVDSVLSCKRVCKTWRALIDDVVFAQAHTHRLQLDDEKQQQKSETFEFFLSTGDTNFGKYNFGEHTYGDITFKLHKTITHDYPFPPVLSLEPSSSNNDYSQRLWLPVSSCNGLICLVSNSVDDHDCSHRVCVYNPLTREYVNLPLLTYEQPLVRRRFITDFGYHPCTKEYKVVLVYYKRSSENALGQGQISVYTLGSGSSTGWRSKGETGFKFGIDRGVLVNGALHWLNLEYFEIIAFDLAEEKLRIVPSPPLSSPVYHSALGVLEGRRLCVMISNTSCRRSSSSNEIVCSMWVMNQDYCSWTKKYNIALDEPYLGNHIPLAQSKGGKILLHYYDEMKIVSSDLKNTSFHDEDVHIIRLSLKKLNAAYPHSHYEIIPYTKSFVSLKALGEDGARTGRNKGFWMNNNNNLLPAHITIDILSRLPVDSVIPCKRVCKMWRDLINDPVFARRHMDRLLLLPCDDDDQQQQQKSAETFEFFLSTRSNSGKYNFVEYTHDEEMTFKLHKSITHDYPFSLPLDQYSYFHNSYWLEPYWIPIGSCNGLICLASSVKGDQNMCVYNPVTREYVNLPSFNINNNTYQPAGDPVGTGFGYHSYTKEYKVVRIYHRPTYYNNYLSQIPEYRYSPGHISVYTLGSGRTTGWRSQGETEYWLKGEGVLANGALHWLRDNYNVVITGYERMDIVAFDLAEEEFKRVPSPPSPAICHTKLGVLGGFLCVMTTKSIHEKVAELWVLSNNSNQENYFSWTKKYSIPWYSSVIPYYNPPLARSKGGKILLQFDYMERISSLHSKITTVCHKRIISYDLKRRSHGGDNYEVVGAINSTDANFRCEIIPYMKSFVSLKALGEHGARIG